MHDLCCHTPRCRPANPGKNWQCCPWSLNNTVCLQIRAPNEFQGTIIGDVNRRKGLIQNSEGEGEDVVVEAQVPLADMFGYSTGLRSMTQVTPSNLLTPERGRRQLSTSIPMFVNILLDPDLCHNCCHSVIIRCMERTCDT